MWKQCGSTVLVSGATGFIGTALVQDLATRGFRVIGASRASATETAPGCPVRKLPSPTTSSDDEFEALVEEVDHVVHLAGLAHTRIKNDAANAYHQANTALSERLARAAAKRLTGKFVLMSSIRAQCGAFANQFVLETDAAQPTDFYGQSKLAAEKAVVAALKPQHFTILRPVVVYGQGVRGNFGHLLTLARLPIPLPIAGLTRRRSILARSSLCRAIAHCLTTSETDGRIFNVADKSPLTIGEIIMALRQGFNKRDLIFPCPPNLLKQGAHLFGQTQRWEAFSGGLVVSADALEKTGWRPVTDTLVELRQLASDL